MVAAARAVASKAPHGLIDDPFAEPLVRAVGVDFFTRWAIGELDPAEVDPPDTAWGMRPMADLMAARTRYFDDFPRRDRSRGPSGGDSGLGPRRACTGLYG